MFPQATATDIIHSGINAGKLNGGMPTTTPIGSRTVWQSTSRETSVRVCPIIWEGMPQAKSTTSSPRRSEPRASLSNLPFSRTMPRAMSEKFCSSRSRNLNRTWARSGAGVARQPGKARAAAAHASSTCSGAASRTGASISAVSAGLKMSRLVFPRPSTQVPPIRFNAEAEREDVAGDRSGAEMELMKSSGNNIRSHIQSSTVGRAPPALRVDGSVRLASDHRLLDVDYQIFLGTRAANQ